MKNQPISLVIKLIIFIIFFLLSAALILFLGMKLGENVELRQALAETKTEYTIVIDAGHGGEDGGAVGTNGCLEKDINLATSKILCDLLRNSGVKVIMTREDDRMLYDTADAGKKKMQDLKNRLKIAEAAENPILISIHMNTFPATACRGGQVYYSPNCKESEAFAQIIQTDLAKYLQPDNKRPTKEATSSIYLLNNLKVPGVLVECGFISSPEETELLCDTGYQHKLALCMYSSILEYINQQKNG